MPLPWACILAKLMFTMSNDKTQETHALKEPQDFIRKIVQEDMAAGRVPQVVTRFPPEPNGFLHIGHAKAISISADIAQQFHGKFILRMDDTNPEKEEQVFIDSIKEDIAWLGFEWDKSSGEDGLRYASDYFDEFYQFALYLIEQGHAYADELNAKDMNLYRGSPVTPGKDSPYRQRPSEESLRIFEEMNNGKHPEGIYTLRAKIDMAHANVHMRDPVLYRIKFLQHPRTQEKCCLFPMYDYAHPLEDAIEGVSHSLCSLEFENHRPVYDWVVFHYQAFKGQSGLKQPRQYEFARLGLSYTTMSKRYLRSLVEQGLVSGWDDPRLPTISGIRRRGFPAQALLNFVRSLGVTKVPSMIDLDYLYHHVREYLNQHALRRFAVLKPLKLLITNYPEGQNEHFDSENNPEDPSAGKRSLLFSRELWIERDDFMVDPPKKYFRLAPGKEVRLKHAYYVTCTEIIKDEQGEVIQVNCTYDPESRGGDSPDKRKVKGTIHWLSSLDAQPAEFRLYDRLFLRENMADMEEGKNYGDYWNPDSLQILHGFVEPALANLGDEDKQLAQQFLRLGYFIADKDYGPDKLVFNRSVGLKDSWAKQK